MKSCTYYASKFAIFERIEKKNQSCINSLWKKLVHGFLSFQKINKNMAI